MVQDLYNNIERLKAEIARLRGKLDSIAIGNQVILNPNTGNNPIPPAAPGALLYGTAGSQWGRRNIGSEGDVLQVQSGFPVWDAAPGGTPSDTVEDETTFGISPDAGVSDEYSRGDHTHGTPASGGGAPTNADYLVGTANGGLSAEIVVGTTPGGELGGTWASPTVDATHAGSTHIGLGTSPSTQAFGDSPAGGSATDAAKTDHKHGMPTYPTFSGARAYNSGNISVNNTTETALTLDSERYDQGGYHSTSSNTSRMTAPVTGYYHIGGNVYWDSNTTGSRDCYLKLNGTTIIAIQHGAGLPADAQQNVNCDYKLTAGDYVELFVYQDSGGTRTITATAARSPEFWMHLIGV